MKYFRNTSWMFAEQMLRLVAGLLVGIWVARYLGPKQFGLFSYVLAFTTIFTSLAKLGLDGIVVRELVSQPEKQRLYLGTAFWLKIIGSVASLGFVFLTTLFSNNDASTNLYLYIITAGLVFQSFEVIDFYFQSQVKAKLVSICKIIQLTLSSLIKIYLVLTKGELLYFVIVSLVDQFSLAISLMIAYWYKKIPGFYFSFDSTIAKNLLKDCWPLVCSALVTSVYMRVDHLMIKEMLGEHDVGIYSAAVRLSEVWYFIPTLITTSVFPAIVNARQQSKALYHERLQKLYTLLVWIAIAIAITMTFLGNWLVVFLYGDDYAAAGEILTINAWTGVFVSLFMVSGRWILAENLTRHSLMRNGFAMVVNISMNYVLITRYGVAGAAIASLLAFASASLIYDVFFEETRRVFSLKIKAFLPFTLIKRKG